MTTTAYRRYQKAYWACMTQGLPAEERQAIYKKMKAKNKKTTTKKIKPKKKTVKKRTKKRVQQQITFF